MARALKSVMTAGDASREQWFENQKKLDEVAKQADTKKEK